jgi:DNA-binding GntR family transcriptional regulator
VAESETEVAVHGVVIALHEMLGTRDLLPGHPVRQESIARHLGTSRAVVREALRILESEGVLHYRRNLGYEVARLTTDELNQTYLMRRLLESELIRNLPPVGPELVKSLEELNRDMKVAADAGDVVALRRLNYSFHFLIFEQSGLDLVVEEVRRIWALSDAYRSGYLYDSTARQQVVVEHNHIIQTVAANDRTKLVRQMDAHRNGLTRRLATLLAGGDPKAGLGRRDRDPAPAG